MTVDCTFHGAERTLAKTPGHGPRESGERPRRVRASSLRRFPSPCREPRGTGTRGQRSARAPAAAPGWPASLYWHKKTLLRVFQIHPERRVSVVGRPGGRLLCSRAAERLSGGLCENNTADGRLCLLGSGRPAGDGQGGCSRSERGRALAAASVLPVLGRKRASWWQRTPRAPKHVLRRGASAGVPGRTRALRGFAGNSRRSGLGQQLLWV